MVPPLKAKLVALIHGDSDNLQLVTDSIHFTKVLSSPNPEGNRRGMIFDQSNFFSPSGGQISDVGVIKAETNQDRRFSLMRSHTAQHLLHWAFEDELASMNFSDRSAESESSIQSSIFHHGGRVEYDRCSVRLTLLETPEKLEPLVEAVQARCRAAIEAKLPIFCQVAEMEQVIEKSFVKRFAWATYPPMVRVICIGGDLETIEEKLNDPPAFYSAELCGGTHLHHTEDLVDVVIVGLRCRNQSIKEVCSLFINPVLLFVAISGESAARSRDYGERMLSRVSTEFEVLETESREAKGSMPWLLDCAERVIALMSQVNSILGGLEENLPYLHRSALTRCQRRLSTLLGGIKTAMRDCASIPAHVDPLTVAQLERLFKEGQTGAEGSPFVGAFNISNFDKAKGKAVEWATAASNRLDLSGRNLGIRVEDFRKDSLDSGADHFAIVRLFSLKDQRQRDWKPHFAKLVHSTTEL
ncbi:unnamed protein product [Taenia asiatica]|uniref:tRNA_SAD domain-containing protein n=1 Tax=Taenia asiatica TaxID=60517 RepID=A0A0R3W1M7_TAEAS|nr:unnamed protein product [Taenia asiatica]